MRRKRVVTALAVIGGVVVVLGGWYVWRWFKGASEIMR